LDRYGAKAGEFSVYTPVTLKSGKPHTDPLDSGSVRYYFDSLVKSRAVARALPPDLIEQLRADFPDLTEAANQAAIKAAIMARDTQIEKMGIMSQAENGVEK
jgi:hypothetical protein